MKTPMDPEDASNRALLAQVRPADWSNPIPARRYDLVVVGGGPAGLVAAAGAAGLGAKVALVERHLLGGDCLNTGCVPSKALLRSAHLAAELRDAERLGGRRASGDPVDFAAVMARVRGLRARLAPHDSAARFRDLGVDVFLGAARFEGPACVSVAGSRLPFHRAVVATGARPAIPDIPGLEAAGCSTSEDVFEWTELPRRLLVLGGGPIGCELAQAFRRLGSEVILCHSRDRLLPREDPAAADLLATRLRAEGVQLLLGVRVRSVERQGPSCRVACVRGQAAETIEVDAVLAATGRRPNVQGLGLESAGVEQDPRTGVRVDDFLRTTNPRVYACGDVCLPEKFTHAADFAARLVVQNALFSLGPLGRQRWSDRRVPRCTYTDPEVAQVGLTPAEARERGVALATFEQPLHHVDRAITDGATEGFVRIHVAAGTDRIVGATVVARNAGDLVGEIGVAMAGRIGLGRLSQVIHPYPTQAEAIRRCGDLYQRTRLTPAVRAWLARWLSWRRGG